MSETTKTIIVPEATQTNNSLAAMLPALLQNRGVDTAALMGMMSGNGNGGFFGNNGGFQDIIALIVIAAIFGNGNFGFGGNNNNNNGAREGREMIMQTLNRNGVDIAAIAAALNTNSDAILAAINSVSQAICNQSAQMGQNFNQVLTSMLQGNNAITAQIADCCCKTQNAITTQGYEGQLRTVQQTQDIVQNATSNANVIAAKIDAQTQIINDKFCQLEMREMQSKLDAANARAAALSSQLSQEHQTNTLQASQAQMLAPISAVLSDLSSRLAKIECNQPPTFPMPYCPASGNYVPVTYGINVNPLATVQAYSNC